MTSTIPRSGPRLDLRLRVKFVDSDDLPEAEATDISPGGARIESRVPLDPGTIVRMELDAGDGEAVVAQATVAWCKARSGLSLRKLYDVGVKFDSEWLAQKRGKLGRALARIFSFSDCEPARAYDRVVVTLRAEGVDGSNLKLTVVDISPGGMQLRSEGTLNIQVKTGAAIIVEIPTADDKISLDGEVMWVAEQDEGANQLFSSFGVRFADLGEAERGVVQAMMDGTKLPESISLFLPR